MTRLLPWAVGAAAVALAAGCDSRPDVHPAPVRGYASTAGTFTDQFTIRERRR